jgi:asparaginyl-tRNA synthetase
MAFFAERIDKDCVERLEHVVESPFERMTYTEAIGAREEPAEVRVPGEWGIDLQSEHERYLTEERRQAARSSS